jgi:hypothetical protein
MPETHHAAPTKPYYKDYCNDEFPVLSFSYALYCDPKFAEQAHAWWAHSVESKIGKGVKLTAAVLAEHGIYDDYLDDYIQNRTRVFPYGAIEIITEKVAANGSQYVQKGLYAPSPGQAKEFVEEYLVPELAGVRQDAAMRKDAAVAKVKKDPGQERGHAEPNPNRPVLSCLAAIFVNPKGIESFRKAPDASLARFELTAAERETLMHFAKGNGSHLTPAEARVFAPRLEDEFQRAPYVW